MKELKSQIKELKEEARREKKESKDSKDSQSLKEQIEALQKENKEIRERYKKNEYKHMKDIWTQYKIVVYDYNDILIHLTASFEDWTNRKHI